MNQSALKAFAQDTRNKLRQLIGTRLDYVLTADTAELRQQAPQVNELRAALNKEGRDPLIERVAYTWFNRLAALRFMDANGYHPFGARVITPATANETLPELLQQGRAGALDADLRASIANPKTFDDLLAGRIPVDQPETRVFTLLLVAACNYYHRLMPFLFEKIGDATELLLPEDLLTDHSIVADFRENLTDEDCQNEEVLGWFYQHYISEKKDEVMGRNAAVPKADIPAVTQLFTPHWIVRYLVENSLGRLWLLNRPQSKLREKMPYYIEGEAETDFLKIARPEDIRLLDPAGGSGHMLTYAFDLLYAIYEEEGYDAPEIPGLILRHNLYGVDICDRAVALAAFALCMKARAKDNRFFRRVVQPNLISLQEIHFEDGELKSYLTALDLDAFFADRTREWIEDGNLLQRRRFFDSQKLAATLLGLIESRGEVLSRLPSFGLESKTEAAYLKFLKDGHKLVELAAREMQTLANSAFRALVESTEILTFDDQLSIGDLARQVHLHLLSQFEEAKNFGALIQPCLDEKGIAFARGVIEAKDLGGQLFLRETHAKVLRVLEQAEYLCQRYQVIVTNPPYMGSGQMNPELKAFVADTWEEGKADSYAAFILQCLSLVLEDGHVGMITTPNWMFLKGFEPLRNRLAADAHIANLVHFGRGVFGSDFGSCAFIIQRGAAPGKIGFFKRLFKRQGEVQSVEQLRDNFFNVSAFPNYSASVLDFQKVAGNPIAYWLSKRVLALFEKSDTVGDVGDPKQGLATCNNDLFLRVWHEVAMSNLGLGVKDREDALASGRRWFPYHKGGDFRKWYGNHELVVNWHNDGEAIHQFNGLPKDFNGAPLRAKNFYFRSGMTWSSLTAGAFSGRFSPPGFIFDSKGPLLFSRGNVPVELLTAYLNSTVAHCFLSILAPTLDFTQGPLAKIPFASVGSQEPGVMNVVQEAIRIARADWDNFETSWDFRDLPLLRSGLKGATLAASWQNWKAHCDAAIRRMQELETENNRLFIAAYGLQDELKPEVPDDQITLARAEARKDMVAFLSYAVGCMLGRFSLDAPGLILADAGATVQDYLKKVPQPTFEPDADGILPVLDGEWFTDDIVARIREFLRVTFGEDTLVENIAFIETALGKVDAKTGKVKPADLRTFLARDFYKEHVRTYKKRPIYWMFSSPEGSFQALIYLHRYNRDTVNLLLNEYVREFIGKLEEKHRQLTAVTLNESARPGDRTKAAKELGKIAKMLKEIQTWERDVLLPLAQQRLDLDLDDGVKVNYLKFNGALVPIPGLEKAECD